MRHSITLAASVAASLVLSATAVRAQTPLTTIRVASELDLPLFVTTPDGDLDRLFIVGQRGVISILRDGAVLPQPFLDIDDKVHPVNLFNNERGLLGLAFHPSYAGNGLFYVHYIDNDGDTVVASYSVSANPDVADAASETVMLTVDQPFSNHNGGMIAFGPNDGYLYIGLGDGGSANDPDNRSQNGQELLGKILRIDVDGPAPYGIPADNPFVGNPAVLDEIWAIGVRNPWRFSFDAATGDLYIGDVGQNEIEEIDFQPFDSAGGENYGWRIMEGTECFDPPQNCDMTGLTLPIQQYTHAQGCSVTGGYVYRGCGMPDLQGTYFYADYCSATIWSFRYDGTHLTEFTDRTNELSPSTPGSLSEIVSFGEDGYGELYIVSQLGGEIFKVVPDSKGFGDCDGDGVLDACDDGCISLECIGQQAGRDCTGHCPGPATLRIRNCSSGDTVLFLYSRTTGPFKIPSGSCVGTSIGLDGSPFSLGTATCNGGQASISGTFPASACGGHLQAVNLSTCSVSNVVTIP